MLLVFKIGVIIVTVGGGNAVTHIHHRRETDLHSTLLTQEQMSDTGYPVRAFSWFFSVSPDECRDSILQIGHGRFLSNPIHHSLITNSYGAI
jgi:hypothetical protein